MHPVLAAVAFFFAPVLATEPFFLNFSSSAPYLFSSVSGLLEQWSNTFFPNGHTISACEIPKHTLFYHGRLDTSDPPSPEWLAFDIEMSYGIMGNMENSRMLTYRTTRPVKCMYFDGMSANLMSGGTEAQMTFIYGDSESIPSKGPWPPRGRKPPPKKGPRKDPPHDKPHEHQNVQKDPPSGWNPLADEYFRAKGLCNWIKEQGLGGRGWGYEGIIRMNAGFELIWCDFESPSLQLLSNLNVSVPLIQSKKQNVAQQISENKLLARRGSTPQQLALGPWMEEVLPEDEGPHGPGMTDQREPFRDVSYWMWFTAAAKRYGSSGMGPGRGEARANIKACGLFSFYDPELSGQNGARIQEEKSYLNLSTDGRWEAPKSEAGRDLGLKQLLTRRRWHRTNHVSKEDGILMHVAVEEGLLGALREWNCSQVDWHLTAQEIVAFYAPGLLNILNALSDLPKADIDSWMDSRTWLESVRVLMHWFMMPFFEYPPGPHTNQSLTEDFSLHSPATQSALLRCRTQYKLGEDENVGEREKTISWAIEETLTAICNSVFEVGLGVEIEWLSKYNNAPKESQDEGQHSIIEDAASWKGKIEELNAWLGWVEHWTGCEGYCKSGEICYIPMWPVGGWHWGDDAEKFLWHPTCINATAYPP